MDRMLSDTENAVMGAYLADGSYLTLLVSQDARRLVERVVRVRGNRKPTSIEALQVEYLRRSLIPTKPFRWKSYAVEIGVK